MIPNPEYKGPWSPKMIDNPAYKGKWEAPIIDNPAYKPMPDLYLFPDTKFVGFELWQVKSGSIFDNILVTDDLAAALQFAQDTWGKSKDAEKAMLEKVEEAEQKKAQAEVKTDEDDKEGGEEDEYAEAEEDVDVEIEEEVEAKDEL